MLNQKKFVSRKQNFRRTIPLKHLLDMRKSIICSSIQNQSTGRITKRCRKNSEFRKYKHCYQCK